AVFAVLVGRDLPDPVEIRIERRVMLVDRMTVTPGGIALPQLYEGPRHRPRILVEDAPGDDDALAERLTLVHAGQVGGVGPGPAAGEPRAGDVGQGLVGADRPLAGRALDRAAVIRMEIGRLGAGVRQVEGPNGSGHLPSSRLGLAQLAKCRRRRSRARNKPG